MTVYRVRETGAENEAAVNPQFKVVDTDVHHGIRDNSALLPYLSSIYQDRITDYGFADNKGAYANNGGLRGSRADLEESSVLGTTTVDVQATRDKLLDGSGVDIAILTGGQLAGASAMPDIDYASALCSAFNSFTIDQWLTADDRFRFAISICTQDPVGAAQEIERIGDHPGVVAIMMPCGAPRPFGHRFYHPIYEACARHGLALALHFSTEGVGVNPPPTAAGFPSYYIESRLARPSFYQAHLASFIFEGVFEVFPNLRVAMLEGGFGWAPAYCWRMDTDWKGLRHQTPWVKRRPSDYVREHIRFSCQPIDEPPKRDDLLRIIEWMDGERILMFSSDYPHWDWEDPSGTFTQLPFELRRRIFADNAHETFNLRLSA